MSLNLEARYRVKGYEGVAFYVHGFPKVWEEYMSWVPCGNCNVPGLIPDGKTQADCLVCNGEGGFDAPSGDGEWFSQDESCGRVIVVMVGDDRKHEVDIDDLAPLKSDEYCQDCGQIGCGWHAISAE
jgi:hypothetical protein